MWLLLAIAFLLLDVVLIYDFVYLGSAGCRCFATQILLDAEALCKGLLPEFIGLLLEGLLFIAILKIFEGWQTREVRVRLKSHVLSFLLSDPPNQPDANKPLRDALYTVKGKYGAYNLDNLEGSKLSNVLTGMVNTLRSSSDTQILTGLLPVTAQLSGMYLRLWGRVISSIPTSSNTDENLKTLLKDFIKEEIPPD